MAEIGNQPPANINVNGVNISNEDLTKLQKQGFTNEALQKMTAQELQSRISGQNQPADSEALKAHAANKNQIKKTDKKDKAPDTKAVLKNQQAAKTVQSKPVIFRNLNSYTLNANAAKDLSLSDYNKKNGSETPLTLQPLSSAFDKSTMAKIGGDIRLKQTMVALNMNASDTHYNNIVSDKEAVKINRNDTAAYDSLDNAYMNLNLAQNNEEEDA